MILLIDNYDSFTHNLYQVVAPFYPEIVVVRNDRISLDEIKKLPLKGIILSPGPGRPEQAGICIQLIRSLNETTPLLGVCLGHQAIGVAFGAQIIQAPEIIHGKSDFIFHQHKNLYCDSPLPFQAGRYHSLLIDKTSLPEILCVQAQNAKGLIMGIRHRFRPIFGVQFHPESILTPDGPQLLKNFVEQCVKVQIC
jgi:anthranilate synthase component II